MSARVWVLFWLCFCVVVIGVTLWWTWDRTETRIGTGDCGLSIDDTTIYLFSSHNGMCTEEELYNTYPFLRKHHI